MAATGSAAPSDYPEGPADTAQHPQPHSTAGEEQQGPEELVDADAGALADAEADQYAQTLTDTAADGGGEPEAWDDEANDDDPEQAAHQHPDAADPIAYDGSGEAGVAMAAGLNGSHEEAAGSDTHAAASAPAALQGGTQLEASQQAQTAEGNAEDDNSPPSAKRAAKQCEMCGQAVAKYCCPGCGCRTCSLACVKAHKVCELTGLIVCHRG